MSERAKATLGVAEATNSSRPVIERAKATLGGAEASEATCIINCTYGTYSAKYSRSTNIYVTVSYLFHWGRTLEPGVCPQLRCNAYTQPFPLANKTPEARTLAGPLWSFLSHCTTSYPKLEKGRTANSTILDAPLMPRLVTLLTHKSGHSCESFFAHTTTLMTMQHMYKKMQKHYFCASCDSFVSLLYVRFRSVSGSINGGW